MEAIYNKLKEGTKVLKDEYLQITREWADKQYDNYVAKSKWAAIDWCKAFGIEPRMANPGSTSQFLSFPKGFYNTKESKTYMNATKEIDKVISMGREKYIAKQVAQSENHYEMSLKKLAYRIENTNMDFLNLDIKTSKIGVNIDTVISDGVQTVKASTIIASGLIQRPHYRYLIKSKKNDK